MKTLEHDRSQSEERCFFTVKLVNINAGLSDLLVRLATNYKIGKALSYDYVHTPFVCPRSYPLSYTDRIIKRLMGEEKVLRQLDKFIGLDRMEFKINDHIFSKYTIVDVPMDDLLANGNFSSLAQLRQEIERDWLRSEPIIFSFLSTHKFYSHGIREKMEGLLQGTGVTDQDFRRLMAGNYWNARKQWPVNIPFDEKKVKIVVHLRKGDRANIKLSNRVICVHGNRVAIADDIDQLIKNSVRLLGGEYKKPLEVSEVYKILEKIFSTYGEKNFSVIVISDGYGRTFDVIKSALSTGKLKLRENELNELSHTEKTVNQEFSILSRFSNVSTIVGESKETFFKSTHAIASADILIRSTGGFASVFHRFFKHSSDPPVVFTIENNQVDLESLSTAIGEVFASLPHSKL